MKKIVSVALGAGVLLFAAVSAQAANYSCDVYNMLSNGNTGSKIGTYTVYAGSVNEARGKAHDKSGKTTTIVSCRAS